MSKALGVSLCFVDFGSSVSIFWISPAVVSTVVFAASMVNPKEESGKSRNCGLFKCLQKLHGG